MKKMKRFASLAMVLALVMSVIPAISAQAETVTIKKTAKEKYIIEKFDDQAEIDWLYEDCEPEDVLGIAVINECGGWYGLTEDHDYVYDEDEREYVQDKESTGVYLNPHSFGGGLTKAQVARSLKNMYGKYSCIKKRDLRNYSPATENWIKKKLIKIARKRYADECADFLEENLGGEYSAIAKVNYANLMARYMQRYPGMDPRVEHTYEFADEDAGE